MEEALTVSSIRQQQDTGNAGLRHSLDPQDYQKATPQIHKHPYSPITGQKKGPTTTEAANTTWVPVSF